MATSAGELAVAPQANGRPAGQKKHRYPAVRQSKPQIIKKK